MPIPVYRSGTIELTCPCCKELFTATVAPITCPKCAANVDLFADREAAQDRVSEYGGTIARGPDNIWIVAFCKDEA